MSGSNMYMAMVMVVSEDAQHRDFLTTSLTTAGCLVARTDDARRALRILATIRFDVLIYDDLSSTDTSLIREIRLRYPGMRTLLVSVVPDMPALARSITPESVGLARYRVRRPRTW